VARARERASCSDSSALFDHSERSERREFADGATRPSIAEQSAQPTAGSARPGLPTRAFAKHHPERILTLNTTSPSDDLHIVNAAFELPL